MNGLHSPMPKERLRLLWSSQKTLIVLSAIPFARRQFVWDRAEQFTCRLALSKLIDPIDGKVFSLSFA